MSRITAGSEPDRKSYKYSEHHQQKRRKMLSQSHPPRPDSCAACKEDNHLLPGARVRMNHQVTYEVPQLSNLEQLEGYLPLGVFGRVKKKDVWGALGSLNCFSYKNIQKLITLMLIRLICKKNAFFRLVLSWIKDLEHHPWGLFSSVLHGGSPFLYQTQREKPKVPDPWAARAPSPCRPA